MNITRKGNKKGRKGEVLSRVLVITVIVAFSSSIIMFQNAGKDVFLSSNNSEESSAIIDNYDKGLSDEAYQQSYGLFDDISKPMWEFMKEKAQRISWYANPDDPLRGIEREKSWLSDNLYPNFNCPHVERVGSGEGRKFICYPHRIVQKERKCLVYSVGCAGDFHFEDAMAEKYDNKCEIHVFDPANWGRKNDEKNKNIHYHAWGLLSSYDKKSKSVVWPAGRSGGFKTFQETLEILGHKDRVVDIFKIDCEGCEWSTHKDWIGFGEFIEIFIFVM
jgi:hypothetical protein